MKQILSLFMFGIGALLFLAFFATLRPTDVTAALGSSESGQCITKAPPTLACRSLILVTDCGLMSGRRSDHRGPRIVLRNHFLIVHYSYATLIS